MFASSKMRKLLVTMELVVAIVGINSLSVYAVPKLKTIIRGAENTRIKHDTEVVKKFIMIEKAMNPSTIEVNKANIQDLSLEESIYLEGYRVDFKEIENLDHSLYRLNNDYLVYNTNTNLPGDFYILANDIILYVDNGSYENMSILDRTKMIINREY